MPLRFGASGSVRASRTPKSARCAQVVHTFCPVTTHSSPSRSARVASDARSEPAPGSLKSWHQISSLRTIGGRKRKPLLLGAVGEQRGRGQVEPERVEPAEVVRPQLGLDDARAVRGARSSPPYATGQVGATRPDAAERRVPGLVVGARAHLADRRGAAANGPRRSTPRARSSSTQVADRVDDLVDRRVRRRPARWHGACRTLIGLRTSGGRRSPERGEPSRKSSLRDDSSSANASFCELLFERVLAALVQQPLRRDRAPPSGPARASCTSSSTSRVERRPADRAVDDAPLRGLVAA